MRHSVRSVSSSSMLRWTTDIHTAAFLKSCSFRVMMFACRAEKGRRCLRVLPWRIYHCVTDKREMSEGIRFSLGEQRVMQRWNVQSEMCSKTQQSQVSWTPVAAESGWGVKVSLYNIQRIVLNSQTLNILTLWRKEASHKIRFFAPGGWAGVGGGGLVNVETNVRKLVLILGDDTTTHSFAWKRRIAHKILTWMKDVTLKRTKSHCFFYNQITKHFFDWDHPKTHRDDSFEWNKVKDHKIQNVQNI